MDTKVWELLQLVRAEGNNDAVSRFLIELADNKTLIDTVREAIETMTSSELDSLKKYIDGAYTPGLRAHLIDEIIQKKTKLQQQLNQVRAENEVYVLEQQLFLYKHTERLMRMDVIEPVTHNILQIAEFRGSEACNGSMAKELYALITDFNLDYPAVTDFLIDLGDKKEFICTIIEFVKNYGKSRKVMSVLAECINRSYTPGLRSHIIDNFISNRLSIQERLNSIRSRTGIYVIEQKLLLYSQTEKLLSSEKTSETTDALIKIIKFIG